MSEIYCIYKRNVYPADTNEDTVEMTSDSFVEGFAPYTDVLGNKHMDVYSKIVNIDEIDLLFSQKYLVKYKDEDFEPLYLSSKVLERKNVLIYTTSEVIANRMGFIKKEQFVFDKSIKLDKIEEVKIIKKPILKFKGKEVTEEVIMKDNIENWLKTLD